MKFVGIFSAFGFLLSFICGLFSGSRFGHILLIAVIFLFVFAGLGFCIYFLFDKFLAGESSSSSDFSPLSVEGAPKKGQAVDIVIQDEDLPSDNTTNQYYVGSSHFMLNAEDMGQVKDSPRSFDAPSRPSQNSVGAKVDDDQKIAPTKAESVSVEKADDAVSTFNVTSSGESSPEKEFVPIRNLETLYNVSGKEAAKNEPQETPAVESAVSPSSNSNKRNFGAEDEQLDTLPSLDDYVVSFGGESNSSSLSDQNVNNDSDFLTGGVGARNVAQPEVKDAELMAKAISTILSSER